MKLVSYVTDQEVDRLGLVLGDGVVPVAATLPDGTAVTSSQVFVGAFPASREAIERWSATLEATPGTPLASLSLNSPIAETPAIMDCSVAPRHLAQAAEVLLSRSAPRALSGAVRRAVRFVGPRLVARAQGGGVLHSNRRATNLVGDGATVPWPDYTSFLDIEPEVAIVVADVEIGADRATVEAAVIGYVIYNDISARDVQLREMASGVMSSAKDMDAGSVIGPFLVTPDEVPDPLALDVTVSTSTGRRWSGSTADYEMTPVELLLDLSSRQSLAAGTVVGMGTVPGTCGLELDEWIEPGERIEISVTGLGTLHQSFGHPRRLDTSSWGGRP
jgi:hypothetical protein